MLDVSNGLNCLAKSTLAFPCSPFHPVCAVTGLPCDAGVIRGILRETYSAWEVDGAGELQHRQYGMARNRNEVEMRRASALSLSCEG